MYSWIHLNCIKSVTWKDNFYTLWKNKQVKTKRRNFTEFLKKYVINPLNILQKLIKYLFLMCKMEHWKIFLLCSNQNQIMYTSDNFVIKWSKTINVIEK